MRLIIGCIQHTPPPREVPGVERETIFLKTANLFETENG
jgi:hypothetical protein